MSHEVVCVSMHDFETSHSKSGVSKSNSWKITSFSEHMSLQSEPFLTMFYTINHSPLLVTIKGFMLIFILSIKIPILSTDFKGIHGYTFTILKLKFYQFAVDALKLRLTEANIIFLLVCVFYFLSVQRISASLHST